MHQRPRRPGRSPDGQRLLGALLPRARHPARWHHAQRQDHRGPGRQLQHLLLWDRGREARAKGRVCGPGAHCDWRGEVPLRVLGIMTEHPVIQEVEAVVIDLREELRVVPIPTWNHPEPLSNIQEPHAPLWCPAGQSLLEMRRGTQQPNTRGGLARGGKKKRSQASISQEEPGLLSRKKPRIWWVRKKNASEVFTREPL